MRSQALFIFLALFFVSLGFQNCGSDMEANRLGESVFCNPSSKPGFANKQFSIACSQVRPEGSVGEDFAAIQARLDCPRVNRRTGINVTGRAVFEKLEAGMQEPPSSTETSIRSSLVRIKSSQEVVVACGLTDVNGQFDIHIPLLARKADLTLEVYALSANEEVQMVVKNSPETNEIHRISQQLVIPESGDPAPMNLVARADDNAGAFNILFAMGNTYRFIKNVQDDLPIGFVPVYWNYGENVNPPEFESSLSVSFLYERDPLGSIYILGGALDQQNQDTDHFDDDVIGLVFGYRILNVIGAAEVGQRGDFFINNYTSQSYVDPRSAWALGLLSYIAGAANGDNNYEDTFDELNSFYVNFDFETNYVPSSPVPDRGNYLNPVVINLLHDLIDSTNEPGDQTTIGFNEIWQTLLDLAGETGNIYNYKDASQFLSILQSRNPTLANDIAATASLHGVPLTRNNYATPLVENSTCSPERIESIENGLLSSDPVDETFRKVVSYSYEHSGGPFNLDVAFMDLGESSLDAQLLVTVLSNFYNYHPSPWVQDGDPHQASVVLESGLSSGPVLIESPNLAPGNYILFLEAYNDAAEATISINGAVHCP